MEDVFEKKVISIEYLTFLINNFQSEIDINMSFLNCSYFKAIQLLAKYCLKSMCLENKLDDILVQAFMELSTYFVTSYDLIYHDHYEKMCSQYSKFMSLEDAKKTVEDIKSRNFEDLLIQHNHFMGE